MGKQRDLAAKVDLVETADKMTLRQLAARVRGFFGIHNYTETADL